VQPKFEQAFQDMWRLWKEAIANPDENRMVGHYWLRDPDSTNPRTETRYVKTLEQIEAFTQKVHTGVFIQTKHPS